MLVTCVVLLPCVGLGGFLTQDTVIEAAHRERGSGMPQWSSPACTRKVGPGRAMTYPYVIDTQICTESGVLFLLRITQYVIRHG